MSEPPFAGFGSGLIAALSSSISGSWTTAESGSAAEVIENGQNAPAERGVRRRKAPKAVIATVKKPSAQYAFWPVENDAWPEGLLEYEIREVRVDRSGFRVQK